MKKTIIKILKHFKKPLVWLAELESTLAAKWSSAAHRRLLQTSWAIPPTPEFFDHHIDLNHLWEKSRLPFWLERGIFSNLALKRGGKMLELSCGDGFNARNFSSIVCESVTACDFDKKAIATATRKNSAPNITYVLADIRNNMPAGKYDNVVWDTAIEHFTPNEIEQIMPEIKHRLTPGGILSGSTIIEQETGEKLDTHEYEFKDLDDLKRFFTPFFKEVTVFETIYPGRHSLYFWASDGKVPFQDGWEHIVRS
ncbi:MAG: class I SAM-dependent methyltransferase [Candidatus Vogelbacteria bacterium]|nr:class I SAM-dependent methyltransferase [Candidatus Vogelbacteria bacterium]